MSGMVEVLAAHKWSETYFTHDKPYECICGERVTDIPNHQTEMLTAAGFGPVNEAKAEAWDEGWSAGAGWPQDDINPYRA